MATVLRGIGVATPGGPDENTYINCGRNRNSILFLLLSSFLLFFLLLSPPPSPLSFIPFPPLPIPVFIISYHLDSSIVERKSGSEVRGGGGGGGGRAGGRALVCH